MLRLVCDTAALAQAAPTAGQLSQLRSSADHPINLTKEIELIHEALNLMARRPALPDRGEGSTSPA